MLEYSFLAIASYIIFFTDYNYLLTLPLFPLFIFFKYIHWYDKKNKLNIPIYYFTLGIVAIYLTVIGEFFFEFYYKFLYYDKILHFIVPIYLSAVVGFFFGKNIRFRKLFIVLSVMGLCALWEMFEFVIDTISGTTMMQGVVINMKELTGGFVDTMKDLSFNLLGSILGSFLPTRNFAKRRNQITNLLHITQTNHNFVEAENGETPAMREKLTNKIWSWSDIFDMRLSFNI